jgi:hypothetical protein
MLIKAFVLDGHDSLQQMRRNVIDSQPVAPVNSTACEDLAALGLDQHGRPVQLGSKSIG